MRTNRQTFLDNLATLRAFLTGETGIDSYHLVTSTFSLVTQNSEELSPACIKNAFRKRVILDHIGNLQVLYGNVVIGLCVLFRYLEMVITSLSVNLEMGLRSTFGGFASALTAFLSTADRALLASQSTLRRAIIARVLNRVALTIGEEGLETHINTDVRMIATAREMLNMRFGFAHDQRIPVPICTMDEMYGLGRALDRTVQLDLEKMSHLLGHNEVFLVLMQIAVFAILPQLDRVPVVRLLEARKADIGNTQLFSSQKAFERLGEPICQHLYGRGGYVFALPFESTLEIIFGGECLLLCILCFDHFKHLIIEHARFDQALHQQGGLFSIWVQTVFKRSH